MRKIKNILCVPAFLHNLEALTREIIVDAIMYEKLILRPVSAFPLFKLYGSLAKDCINVCVDKGYSDIVNELDGRFDIGFRLAFILKNKIDMPPEDYAALVAIGTIAGVHPFVKKILGKKPPLIVYNRIRNFYEDNKDIKVFERPFSRKDYLSVVFKIEEISGVRKSDEIAKYILEGARFDYVPTLYKDVNALINDLVLSLFYANHRYMFTRSCDSSMFKAYSSGFKKFYESIHKTSSLSQEFKEFIRRGYKTRLADESLNYLLGRRIGDMRELLGFEPLDPLKLMKKEIEFPRAINEKNVDGFADSFEEVGKAVLKIRKKSEKFRKLIEDLQVNCLGGNVEKAVEKKMELEDQNPSQSISYYFLYDLGQFVKKRVVQELEKRLDNELRRKRKISYIDKVCGRVSLVFSAITLVSSYYGFKVPLELEGAMLSIKVLFYLLKEGMQFFPGFDIYASFKKWPAAES